MVADAEKCVSSPRTMLTTRFAEQDEEVRKKIEARNSLEVRLIIHGATPDPCRTTCTRSSRKSATSRVSVASSTRPTRRRSWPRSRRDRCVVRNACLTADPGRTGSSRRALTRPPTRSTRGARRRKPSSPRSPRRSVRCRAAATRLTLDRRRRRRWQRRAPARPCVRPCRDVETDDVAQTTSSKRSSRSAGNDIDPHDHPATTTRIVSPLSGLAP